MIDLNDEIYCHILNNIFIYTYIYLYIQINNTYISIFNYLFNSILIETLGTYTSDNRVRMNTIMKPR